MKKELPSDFRKKISRLHKAKENIKDKSCEKTKQNKALRDRNVEIQQSRDLWRSKWEENKKEYDALAKRLKVLQKERDRDEEQSRKQAKKDLEYTEQLQKELEELRKKTKKLSL